MGTSFNRNFMKQIGFLILFALFAAPVFAQSTNENFPTPLLQNEITGLITARDIGDSRLTRHFYTFFADNGDVNLAIETENFDGDVDLFEAVTLRPLVKITITADTQPSKTSRVVYFRKRAQVVLRIEGRSLTGDAASYRLAFSGSFAAASDLPQSPTDVEPKVAQKSNPDAVARVNSAGAIIEVLEPSKPVSEPATVKTTGGKSSPIARGGPRIPRRTVAKPKPVVKTDEPTAVNPIETTAENPPAKTDKSVAARKPTVRTSKPKGTTTTARATNSGRASSAKKPVRKVDDASASSQPDPLANVQLIILLKNGERVERVMSDVFNVSVDKGQITVVTKAGKIERYNLLEVQKMTIE
jgi:hypothetical protein